VRAVYELARDWSFDINAIVDEHRKPHHHGALEDAQAARLRSELIGRTVPEPPFKKAGGISRKNAGTLSGAPSSQFTPRRREQMFVKRNRHW
jgi:hypothetical protein